jgi:hypothetical protein
MAVPLFLLAALQHCFFAAMIVFLDFSRLVAALSWRCQQTIHLSLGMFIH